VFAQKLKLDRKQQTHQRKNKKEENEERKTRKELIELRTILNIHSIESNAISYSQLCLALKVPHDAPFSQT